MEMEKFTHLRRVLREKRKSLVADWRHDRSELMVKIKASVIDYNEQAMTVQAESERNNFQKALCAQLTEQVLDFLNVF